MNDGSFSLVTFVDDNRPFVERSGQSPARILAAYGTVGWSREGDGYPPLILITVSAVINDAGEIRRINTRIVATERAISAVGEVCARSFDEYPPL